MLERNATPQFPGRPSSDTHFIDVDRLLGVALRQWRVVAACVGIGIALGTVYLALAPRSYFASSQILIDQNQQQLVTDVTQQASTVTLENEVLNEMQVLRSSRIAGAVVAAEHLDTDLDFLNPPPSFMGRIADILRGLLGREQSPQVTSQPVERVTQQVMRGITVERVGRSSVLVVGFTASTPELAYRIADAVADAFIREQLNTDATSQAATWLQQQLTELGESRRQASDALEQFRQESGQNAAEDVALSAQKLQALTTQLVVAQSDTARARALSVQLQAAVAAGPDAAGGNAMLLTGQNQLDQKTSDLIAQYSSTVRRKAEVTSQFGPDHPQVAVLERQRAALSQQIFALLNQLNERYANELAIAEGREETLRQDLQVEGQLSTADNQQQVRLNELQQKVSALEVLYNSFLARYEETMQRQSFPITSARIITEPVIPRDASSPRGSITMIGAVLFGGFLGLCFAALNEIRERSFRLGAQVTRELGVHFIGYLPDLRTRLGRRYRRSPATADSEMQQIVRGDLLSAKPNSAVTIFAETLKSSKLALHSRHDNRHAAVLGVTSILPGEGKTTYAVAFAEMLATSDSSKVLLIDGDLRHPAASERVAPGATAGLIDAVEGRAWRTLLKIDAHTGLAVLPATTSLKTTQVADPLSSAAMSQLLDEAREAFDYVIIDLPPVGPMVDALSVLPLTDGFMLVVEWGRTPRRLVRNVIEREPQLESGLVGVVLNKVNFDRLARYSELGDSERYIRAYDSYYRVQPPVQG